MSWNKAELALELLQCRLELESMRENFGHQERIAWAAKHLEEYAARLAGVLALPGWTLDDVANGDALGIVEVGSELVGKELRGAEMPSNVSAAWQTYCAQLSDIKARAERQRSRTRTLLTSLVRMGYGQNGSDKHEAERLWKAARELCAALEVNG